MSTWGGGGGSKFVQDIEQDTRRHLLNSNCNQPLSELGIFPDFCSTGILPNIFLSIVRFICSETELYESLFHISI